MPEAAVPGLQPIASGKVRELYDAGEGRLLLVASDRISAFDVVLPTAIPDKGRVLTQLSAFWFARFGSRVPTHLVSTRLADLPPAAQHPSLAGRAMLVRRLDMLPVEWVVRGYLAGSGWRDYRASGAICGVVLPDGLREAAPLPEPILTPATKAVSGHDENISAAEARRLVGADRYDEAARLVLSLYAEAAAHARACGIVLADTKFELGLDADGRLTLADEAVTPDSSRFWPLDAYAVGASPPSFDKQYVRDWLETQPWDKTAPGPHLPADVAEGTARRYREAYERLTGRPLPAAADPAVDDPEREERACA